MAHIAFCSVPLHGHVTPSLPVVTELVRRGHRITYATAEGFAKQVAGAGADPVRYATTFPSPDMPGKGMPDDDTAGAFLFLQEAITVLPQMESAYARDLPDLLVHDMGAFQAPILAEKWDIPAVQLSPSHAIPDGISEVVSKGRAETSRGMAEFEREFRAFVAAQDVAITPEDIQARPKRSVVTIPEAFQFAPERLGPRHTFVGPMLSTSPPEGDWEPPGDAPVLLVSLGSVSTRQVGFYRKCIEAFGDSAWHVVLVTGEFIDQAALGELPANIRAPRWIPQSKVLAHANAFVTHGGMGGTMLALRHRVPMVCVPQMAGQPLTAKRIAELNLGVHVAPEDATAAVLRAAVAHVTDDASIAENLEWMRRQIDDCGGAALAADVIEGELGD